MKKLFLFLLILAAPGGLPVAWAQLVQVQRLEIDPYASTESRIYGVTTLGNQGLLVSTQPQQVFYNTDNYWTFARYDTSLAKVWEKRFDIDWYLRPTQVYLDSAFLYVLLTRRESVKFKIFQLNHLTGGAEMMEGSSLTPVTVTDFKVMSQTAYLGGYVNKRPVVVAFGFLDKRSRVLPALYEPRSELVSIEIDPVNRAANIVVSNAAGRQRKLFLKTFDYAGRIIKNLPLQSDQDKTLHTARITSLTASEQLVMGNYGVRNSPFFQGMYLARLNDDRQEYIQYFGFNDLRSFFDYLPPPRRRKVRERITRLRQQGREMQLNHRFLMHDVIETKDQYIVVAEAYLPQKGASYMASDRYRYTHAVVCGFDKAGNLLWDNCFEISGYGDYQLRKIVEIAVNEDKIVLAYPGEGCVYAKVIRGGDVVKDKEKYKMKTNFEGDKVNNAAHTSIAHWYGSYFITWAVQQISNGKDTGVEPYREVFSLGKLVYRSEASTLLPEQK